MNGGPLPSIIAVQNTRGGGGSCEFPVDNSDNLKSIRADEDVLGSKIMMAEYDIILFTYPVTTELQGTVIIR